MADMLRQEELRSLADMVISDFYMMNSESKDSLRDYVAGLTEEEPANITNLMCTFYYSVQDRKLAFENEYKTNQTVKEMALRLLRLLEEKRMEILVRVFKNNKNRYFFYKEAGFAMETYIYDIKVTMEWMEHMKFFMGLDYLINIVNGVSQHCPEIARTLADEYLSLSGKLRDVAAVFAAEEKDEKTVELELKDLERRAFSENSRDNSMGFLYQFLSFCTDISEAVDQMAEGLLCRCPSSIHAQINGSGVDWFLKLCSSLHAGNEPKMDFLLTRIAQDWEQDRRYDMKGIKAVAHKDGHVLTETFEKLCRREDDRALTAFALMRKLGFLTPDSSQYEEFREMARKQIMKGVSREQESYALAGRVLFQFPNGAEDFSSLQADNPDDVSIVVDPESVSQLGWGYGQNGWSYLLYACSMLIEEFTEARNLAVLTAKELNGYLLTYMRLYDFSRDFFISEGNPWEKLYRRRVPFYLLCKLGVSLFGQTYWYEKPQKIQDELMAFLKEHKEETEQEVRETHMDGSTYLSYIKQLFPEHAKTDSGVVYSDFDLNCLAGAFASKSHYVVEYAEKLLQTHETEVRDTVEEAAKSGHRGTANAAQRLLRLWDNEKIEKVMQSLTDLDSFYEYIEKQYTKNNEKNVPFPKLIDYGCVRMKDSEVHMPANVLKYFLSEYILLKELYIVKPCEEIKKRVNPYDLQNLMKQVYETWLAEGAGPKYRNLLFPYAICAGSSQIGILKKQIDDWSQNSKPGLAEFAVKCLAMNGSQMAFMMVDTMAKKHKNKRVKKAAAGALTDAMGVYGFGREEFEDLIVPDMGFSKDRVRMFSYGTRQFKAVLGTDLNITLYDGDKVIKSLPKASEKYGDAAEAAEAAKEELKAVKKQMKTVVDAQKARMGNAVYTQRNWTQEKWEALFIGNPLMFTFACGMVWQEIDRDNTALGTFRYMEDGTFNTSDEEEYELHEGSSIHLVHPADMETADLKAWKAQLEDYEIVQPAPQLNLPVVELDGEAQKEMRFPGFEEKKFYSATVRSVAGKLGCELSFEDYGECCGFYREFESDGLFMNVTVTSFYPGDYNAITEIKAIEFRNGSGQVPLLQVPSRLLSFADQAGSMLTAKAL